MLVRQMANPIKAVKKLWDTEVTLKSTQNPSVFKWDNDGSPNTLDIIEQFENIFWGYLETKQVKFQVCLWHRFSG